MPIYTDPPKWGAEGQAPPQEKRNAGWHPKDRVPSSWLNWFFRRVSESLREIAQAFVNHRDASAPHDGHETKTGATAKVKAHSDNTTGVHGIDDGFHVAKTKREDQRVGWDDVVDKPDKFPPETHNHDERYYTKQQSDGRYAAKQHKHTGDDLPKASTSVQGIVQLTNSRTSTSDTLALTARSMDQHRGSGDHDGRYYTKAQMDQRIPLWMVPGDTLISSFPGDARTPEFGKETLVLVYVPPHNGRFRIRADLVRAGGTSLIDFKIYVGGVLIFEQNHLSPSSISVDSPVPVSAGGQISFVVGPTNQGVNSGFSNIRIYGVPGAVSSGFFTP